MVASQTASDGRMTSPGGGQRHFAYGCYGAADHCGDESAGNPSRRRATPCRHVATSLSAPHLNKNS